MANRTEKGAVSIHGANPQFLVEKIIRSRIYESLFWKEQCFALTAETIIDKAAGLDHVGGTTGGNIKPTPFLCLILKLLQLQPEKEIIVEYILQEDYKYLRALGAFYLRLVGEAVDIYQYLEPLYLDYRKLRVHTKLGGYVLTHMDEFVDQMLREERLCDIILPRLTKREVLEDQNLLPQHRSPLEDDLELMELDEPTADEESSKDRKRAERNGSREREKQRERKKSRSRSRSRERHHDHDRRDRGGGRSRSRSRSRERHRRDRDNDRDRRSRRRSSSRDRNGDRDRSGDRDRDRRRRRSRSHS